MADLAEQHQDAVYEKADEIDLLIVKNPRVKSIFTKHIDRFCKMVEDYGQAVQPYEVLFRKTLKKMGKPLSFRNMPDGWKIFCEAFKRRSLPNKNWINVPKQGTEFVMGGAKEAICCLAQPKNAVNPLVWFELESQPQWKKLQRDPDESEELMLNYVLLAVVHDRMMQQTKTKLFPIIGGKWFDRAGFYHKVCKTFCNDIHPALHRDPQSPILPEERVKLKRELREKLSQFNGAFVRVRLDLRAKGLLKDEEPRVVEQNEKIVLTQNQHKILKYLKEINTAVAQVDIESQTGLSNKTVSAELRVLKEYNFVAPPKGKTRRIVITQKGVDCVNQNYTKTT